MSTFDEVRAKIALIPEKLRKHAPGIVAETATEFFKDSFRNKGWDGEPWQAVKSDPGRGSLMVRSGELQASIRPSLVSESTVTISAGSPSVPYARIHNEGGTITQIPTEKQRRFLWAKAYGEKGGIDGGGDGGNKWAAAAKSKRLTIPIPQRQFMGQSEALNDEIIKRLKLLVNEL